MFRPERFQGGIDTSDSRLTKLAFLDGLVLFLESEIRQRLVRAHTLSPILILYLKLKPTLLCFSRVVFSPGHQLGLRHHVFCRRSLQACRLLPAKLNVAVESILAELAVAVVTGLVVVLWLGGFLLLRGTFWGGWDFLFISFPDFVSGIKHFLWFAFYFFTNLNNKMVNDKQFTRLSKSAK